MLKIKDNRLKLIALVGPTASGKSELAVELAKLFNGEIISCDSRQIYKGLDLGTGKVPGKWIISKNQYNNFKQLPVDLNRTYDFNQHFIYKGVVHHLIDFVSPKKQYSVSLFKKAAQKTIADILSRGKLPILCGGTAHWIDAIVYNQTFPNVKPNLKLRSELEKQTTETLFNKLTKLDPTRAEEIDKFNKHRLIRALEIVITTGKPVPKILNNKSDALNCLWLGINPSQKILYKKIDERLKQRLVSGMIEEVEKLHKQLPPSPSYAKRGQSVAPVSLSWKRLESFGLEYKFIAQFLQKKLSYHEMVLQLSYAIKHYSKRQITWWKRNKEIIWLKNTAQAKTKVKKFLA